MKLSITHQTHYAYGVPVASSHHLAHLTPLNGPTQQVIAHQLGIDPAPDRPVQYRTDVYGNTLAQWFFNDNHSHLTVRAHSVVHTRLIESAQAIVTCHQAAQATPMGCALGTGDWTHYIHPTAHVPRHNDLGLFARPDFAPERPLVEAAVAFMHRIRAEMTYDSQSTQVDTPALQALQARRGVCQDFTHIMLAGLRHMGHAACYVSGYLLTQPAPGQPRLIGADASHAWVAVYVPGLDAHPSRGWLHLDPTNARHGWGSPGTDYVELARGRDFADVSPLRGVLRGGDASPPQVSVTVLPM